MKLHELKPAIGSRHRKKIVGRGWGSGHGGSSTRGTKGQNARSGGPKSPWFEGGQMPLLRRIPKRGFTNASFREEYSYVNVGEIEKKFQPGSEITPEILFEKGLIRKRNLPVKILGGGELKNNFTVKADKFTKSAIEKIKSSGGVFEIC